MLGSTGLIMFGGMGIFLIPQSSGLAKVQRAGETK